MHEETAPRAFEFLVGRERRGDFRRGHVVLLARDDERFREFRLAQRQSRARDHDLRQRELMHDVARVGPRPFLGDALQRVGNGRVVFGLFIRANRTVRRVQRKDLLRIPARDKPSILFFG